MGRSALFGQTFIFKDICPLRKVPRRKPVPSAFSDFIQYKRTSQSIYLFLRWTILLCLTPDDFICDLEEY